MGLLTNLTYIPVQDNSQTQVGLILADEMLAIDTSVVVAVVLVVIAVLVVIVVPAALT